MARLNLIAVVVVAACSLAATAATAQGYQPQSNYLQHCAGCHHLDGSGFPPEVPNLRVDLGYLIDTAEGRDFMLRVPGVVGVPITTAEVTDLMNWIMTTFYPERTDFVPFTVEEIESGRARPLYDPITYRSEMFPGLYQDQ